jgi:hypothetical protein
MCRNDIYRCKETRPRVYSFSLTCVLPFRSNHPRLKSAFASSVLTPITWSFIMVALNAVLALSAVVALVGADGAAGRKDKGYYKVTPNSTLRSRDLFKRQCEGTCSECFGSGYTLCPGSTYYCYLPGDSLYGLDSCSSDSDSSSSPEPTSTGSAGDSDFCSGTGATCVSCFGAGYLDCPDNYHWYAALCKPIDIHPNVKQLQPRRS